MVCHLRYIPCMLTWHFIISSFNFLANFSGLEARVLEVFFPLHASWILGLICLFFFYFSEEGKHKGACQNTTQTGNKKLFSVWYLEQRRIESLQLSLMYKPNKSIKIYQQILQNCFMSREKVDNQAFVQSWCIVELFSSLNKCRPREGTQTSGAR